MKPLPLRLSCAATFRVGGLAWKDIFRPGWRVGAIIQHCRGKRLFLAKLNFQLSLQSRRNPLQDDLHALQTLRAFGLFRDPSAFLSPPPDGSPSQVGSLSPYFSNSLSVGRLERGYSSSMSVFTVRGRGPAR